VFATYCQVGGGCSRDLIPVYYIPFPFFNLFSPEIYSFATKGRAI